MAISHIGTINQGGTSVDHYDFDLSSLSCATGDLLLVKYVVEEPNYTCAFNLDDSGWQTNLIVDNQRESRNHRTKIWWNTIDGSTITATSTITLTQGSPTSDEGVASLMVFRGVDTTTPFDTPALGSEAAGVGYPLSMAKSGFSTDDWVLFMGSMMFGKTYVPPTDWIEVADHTTDATSGGVSHFVCYRTGVTSTAADLSPTPTNGSPDYWLSETVIMYMAAATNDPPTVALDTADEATFNDSTPTLEFTGTDADGDDIRYNIQITDNPDGFAGGVELEDNYDPGSYLGIIHPNPDATLTWNGDYQVDDRPGQSLPVMAGFYIVRISDLAPMWTRRGMRWHGCMRTRVHMARLASR
ncbi:MAG: hypothetical protein HC804_14605 [Anaerolineae bacterium]|nr:hypothetical protein [Anaerolineae bacterium]